MDHNQYILQVPNPCKEDWHQMAPDQNGRFCVHCSKAVIDFTQLTDEQIIDLIEKQQGELCGRLTSSQLNRVLETPQQPVYQRGRFKEIIAALLLLFTSKEIIANKTKAEKILVVQPSNISGDSKIKTDDKDTAHLKELTGTVLDKEFKEPIQFAIVENYTTKQGQFTDSNGRFRIAASIGDSISIKCVGFESMNFVVYSIDSKMYSLDADRRDLGGAVVITKKVSLRYKIRRFFHLKYKPKHSAT